MKRIIDAGHYEADGLSIPINGGDGLQCYVEILDAIYGEMSAMLNRHCKVLAFRMDFHLHEYTEDNEMLSRFLRKVRKWVKRRYKGVTFGYVWAREMEKAKRQHYHIWFLFDGSKVRVPFNLILICEDVWQGWGNPKPYTPRNCYYLINRGDEVKFNAAFMRASYLAKTRGKGYKASKANDFGSSRHRFNQSLDTGTKLAIKALR